MENNNYNNVIGNDKKVSIHDVLKKMKAKVAISKLDDKSIIISKKLDKITIHESLDSLEPIDSFDKTKSALIVNGALRNLADKFRNKLNEKKLNNDYNDNYNVDDKKINFRYELDDSDNEDTKESALETLKSEKMLSMFCTPLQSQVQALYSHTPIETRNEETVKAHEIEHFEVEDAVVDINNGDFIKDKEFDNVTITNDCVKIIKPLDESKPKSVIEILLKIVIPKNTDTILGYDVYDMPRRFVIAACLGFWIVFLFCGFYIGVQQYYAILNQKFISLDKESGNCIEVPRGMTGNHFADKNGYWSTNRKYKYENTLYGVFANQLKVTSEQWITMMQACGEQVRAITVKGTLRDFSWNMVLWSSYSSTIRAPDVVDAQTGEVLPGGTLQFYAKADSDIIFGEREILSTNLGNKNGACAPMSNTKSVFDKGSKSFVITQQICNYGPCQYVDGLDYCVESGENVINKNIFYPSQFGYLFGKTPDNYVKITVDSRSLTTALAINMHMISISDLQQVEVDDVFEKFKRKLVKDKVITKEEKALMGVFYDHLYSPMDPIYCMVYMNKFKIPSSVFGLGDDDDDTSIKAQASLVSEIKYVLAFGLVIKGVDASTIHYTTCGYDIYDKSKGSTCNEYIDLESTVTSYLGSLSSNVGNFTIYSIQDINVQVSRRLEEDITVRKLALATNRSPTRQPTIQPTGKTVSGVSIGIFFSYSFMLDSDTDILSNIDQVVESFYSGMEANPAMTGSSVFSGTELQSEYFSFIGYYDQKVLGSSADFDDDTYYSTSSATTNALDSSISRRIFEGLSLPKVEENSLRILKQDIGSRLKARRKLALSQKIKVDKTSGAACYIRAGNTFLYPVVKDYGVGEVKPIPVNSAGNNDFSRLEDKELRMDGTPFKYFPLECTLDMVANDDPLIRQKYSTCLFFHMNIGFVFYPGVPKGTSSKEVTTNGKIFQFGKNAFDSTISDPINGDILMASKAYNAMLSLSYESRFRYMKYNERPPLNISQWNKVFYELCERTGCSLISLELYSGTRAPSVNQYMYRPSESPAFNNVLLQEKAMVNLENAYPPEDIIEKFYTCTSFPLDAFNQALGIANSNSQVYGTLALTALFFIVVLVSLTKNRRKKFLKASKKEELDAYGKELMHRKLIQTLSLLANTARKKVGDTDEVKQVLLNIKELDLVSQGHLDVQEEHKKGGKKKLAKNFLGYCGEFIWESFFK